MRSKAKNSKQKIKSPKGVASDTPNTYELYRTLPNPQYGSGQNRSRRGSLQAPPKERRRPSWKKIIVTILIVLAMLLFGYGSYIGYKFIKDFGWDNLFGLFHHTTLKGEAQGRVNILLAGYSIDDPNHGGAALTDSIMLVSIDTRTHKAFMLSVPRDLWVNIPGYGYSKINAAYEDGQAEHFSAPGYPSGGMGLLEQLVSQKFNIPIDYYALIDYTAFRDAVDAVGGIRIDIQSPDPRGLYDPNTNLDLPNGWVSLDGTEALDLARARGDGYGSYGFPAADFDRTMHQRQMLVALAAKASTIGVISNPIKVGELLDAYGNNVKTDLQLNDLVRLNDIIKQIPQSKIASAALEGATYNGQKNVNLVVGEYTDYQDVLIPAAGLDDYAPIDAYVAQLETQN